MQRDGRVRCVALSDDGSVLVVGGFDRKVVLHAVDEGAQLYDFDPRTAGVVRSVHLPPDSSRLAVGTEVDGAGPNPTLTLALTLALTLTLTLMRWTARGAPTSTTRPTARRPCTSSSTPRPSGACASRHRSP